MNWSQFKTEVRELMPLHANRQGAQGLIDRLIQATVQDIQRLIPFYRDGWEARYQPIDLVVEGQASRGQLPTGARPMKAETAFLDDDGNEVARVALTNRGWGERMSLMNGGLRHAICIAPTGGLFYATPDIGFNRWLVITWSGLKETWGDADGMPKWGGKEAMAVAYRVSSELARVVDNDLRAAETFWTSYLTARQSLFIDAGEQTTIAA